MTADEMLCLIDNTLHQPEPLPEHVAKTLAHLITCRSIAADNIETVLARETYKHDDFMYWRGEHIETTKALGAFGIKLNTYKEDAA